MPSASLYLPEPKFSFTIVTPYRISLSGNASTPTEVKLTPRTLVSSPSRLNAALANYDLKQAGTQDLPALRVLLLCGPGLFHDMHQEIFAGQ